MIGYKKKPEALSLKRAIKQLVLLVCTFLFLFAFPAAADAENAIHDTDVTMEKLEALLSRYAPEGLYIISHSGNSDLDVLSYWKSTDALIDGVDTAVHESFHEYTQYVAPTSSSEAIYIGNGKKIVVHFTNVFDTSVTAAWISPENRSFRYSTYVQGTTSASNKLAVYGMLNELAAYGWGMYTMVSLYPYFKENTSNYKDWYRFLLEGENDRNAYAEFTYWIVNYLEYARTNNKVDYQQIKANKKFIKAFRKTEKRYRENIRLYEKYSSWINQTYSDRTYNYVIDNWYEKLCTVINSNKYALVRNKLGLAKLPSYR